MSIELPKENYFQKEKKQKKKEKHYITRITKKKKNMTSKVQQKKTTPTTNPIPYIGMNSTEEPKQMDSTAIESTTHTRTTCMEVKAAAAELIPHFDTIELKENLVSTKFSSVVRIV